MKCNSIAYDNLSLAVIVAFYVAVTYAVHALLGIRNRVALDIYYLFFTVLSLIFSAFFLLLHLPNKCYRKYLSARYLVGFAVIFVLAPLFTSAFASFKQTIPLIHPFSWDPALMRLDYLLHFGHHPWRLLEWMLDYPIIIRIIDVMYMLWFAFLTVSCLWMAWTQRRKLRLCFFISALLVWAVLGSGLGTLFSSAGPCYYSEVVATGENPFTPLMLKISNIHQTTPLFAIKNQIGLWTAQMESKWLPFGGISAMPSIHLAMATLFVFLAFSVRKWLGIAFIVYVLVMQIGSVILGWHYAIDGYMGIAFASLIWCAIKKFVDRPLKHYN
jgi:membrane-associated phospholipid phosphatase